MPELRFVQPCRGCPFRRTAPPGWLGAAPPEEFTEGALADYAAFDLPCHETINYDDADWLHTQFPTAALCAGALIFCANHGKSPREPRRNAYVAAVKRDPVRVFTSPEEFIEHHRGGSVRSWER